MRLPQVAVDLRAEIAPPRAAVRLLTRSGPGARITRAQHFATYGMESIMRLTLVGKDPDSNPTGSPTVYRTDRDTWVVQGWIVKDHDALAQMSIPAEETAVEIPDRIVHLFRQ